LTPVINVVSYITSQMKGVCSRESSWPCLPLNTFHNERRTWRRYLCQILNANTQWHWD